MVIVCLLLERIWLIIYKIGKKNSYLRFLKWYKRMEFNYVLLEFYCGRVIINIEVFF